MKKTDVVGNIAVSLFGLPSTCMRTISPSPVITKAITVPRVLSH